MVSARCMLARPDACSAPSGSCGLTLDGVRFTKSEIDRRRGVKCSAGYVAVPAATTPPGSKAGGKDDGGSESGGSSIGGASGANGASNVEPVESAVAPRDTDSESDIVE